MPRPHYLVTSAGVLGGHRLRLMFEDGTVGEIDLEYLARRGGVFEPLLDPEYFGKVRVDDEGGTIVWPNEADVAPETLYDAAQPSGCPGR